MSKQRLRAVGGGYRMILMKFRSTASIFFNKRQTIILSLLNIITYIGKAF